MSEVILSTTARDQENRTVLGPARNAGLLELGHWRNIYRLVQPWASRSDRVTEHGREALWEEDKLVRSPTLVQRGSQPVGPSEKRSKE